MKYLCLIMCAINSLAIYAQGPPVMTDSPIILGKGRTIIKTLTQYIRAENDVDYLTVPLIVHYTIDSDKLVGIHLPYVTTYNLHGKDANAALGDIDLLYNHQFYQWDKQGKTFRMLGKFKQTIPTGTATHFESISMNAWKSTIGLVSGYESLEFGLLSDVGYKIIAEAPDQIYYNFGFGLPLLPHQFPPKQVNVYIETQGEYHPETGKSALYYTPALQYATYQWTVEIGAQLPIYQLYSASNSLEYSLIFGARFVL